MKPESPLAHPCFDKEASFNFGRVHLPIAPKCNVQCNFCNRKFDCVNESRPGVTSAILSPHQALRYFDKMYKKAPISVAGIAGPGDPFANPEETLETFRLIKKKYPHVLACVSTNGLNLMDHIVELKKTGVTHVTITINALNPDIAVKIYSWFRYKKRLFRGKEGAQLLIENQLSSLSLLKQHGFIVKINTIVIPGVNDEYVKEIAYEAGKGGADYHNCIPMYPVEGTSFADIQEPGHDMMSGIKNASAEFLPQMKHCQRCRADAAGLISQKDPSFWLDILDETKKEPLVPQDKRPYVAAATREGFLINQHLGEAEYLNIYEFDDGGRYHLVEKRKSPQPGEGALRWQKMAEILYDCHFLLVSGVGNKPKTVIEKNGIKVKTVEGLIAKAIELIAKGEELSCMSAGAFSCGSSCSGGGEGCG